MWLVSQRPWLSVGIHDQRTCSSTKSRCSTSYARQRIVQYVSQVLPQVSVIGPKLSLHPPATITTQHHAAYTTRRATHADAAQLLSLLKAHALRWNAQQLQVLCATGYVHEATHRVHHHNVCCTGGAWTPTCCNIHSD